MIICPNCKSWITAGASECAKCGARVKADGTVYLTDVDVPDELPPRALLARRPWLKNKQWRQRKIVFGTPVRGSVLFAAYFFFGLPALFFLWVGITDPSTQSGESLRIPGLGIGSLLAFILGALTYWRLRRRRYGDSVCRLITLPGVVGGWLKADVDCKLPEDPDHTVVVHLKNFVQAGKRANEVWRMEERLAVRVTPGTRSTVPVRLRIPRDSAQRPMMVGRGFWASLLEGDPAWILEIEKKVPGIDFFASFHVPVYDTTDAPVQEQGADEANRKPTQ